MLGKKVYTCIYCLITHHQVFLVQAVLYMERPLYIVQKFCCEYLRTQFVYPRVRGCPAKAAGDSCGSGLAMPCHAMFDGNMVVYGCLMMIGLKNNQKFDWQLRRKKMLYRFFFRCLYMNRYFIYCMHIFENQHDVSLQRNISCGCVFCFSVFSLISSFRRLWAKDCRSSLRTVGGKWDCNVWMLTMLKDLA